MNMRKETSLYVSGVFVAALCSAVAVFALFPGHVSDMTGPLVVICALALLAELLSFVVAGSVTGSMASIPYLAAILIVPSWPGLVASSVVKLIVEMRPKPALKATFNVSQHALSTAIAIIVYRSLGGVSLLGLAHARLAEASLRTGAQAFVAILFSLGLNALLVGGVIAFSTGRRLGVVYNDVLRSTVGVSALGAPIIFIFAWVFVSFGWIAAVAIWVPILGLRQVHKANLDLEKMNRELLELMVKSIEARDPYTSGHSRRVNHYSTIIARSLGLKEREVTRIGQAALLHDVGKIHEKYAPILRKADRLTPDEWLVMRQHPIDGENLVATMSGLQDLVPAIRHHHENWDGTGYPDGLAGELIPLAARIIMLADTIDAMTSERPYRRPLCEDQVRAEIVSGRGRQFDPQISDVLLAGPMWRLLFPSTGQRSTPRAGLHVIPATPRRRAGTA